MMRLVIFVGAVAAFLASAAKPVQKCSRADEAAVLPLVAAAKISEQWPKAVFDIYKKLGPCAEGFHPEVMTDLMMKKLAYEWNQFPRLATLARKKGFETFVLQNINRTGTPATLEQIKTNTKEQCPPAQGKFCQAIFDAASTP